MQTSFLSTVLQLMGMSLYHYYHYYRRARGIPILIREVIH
jgi:hypothetical protein